MEGRMGGSKIWGGGGGPGEERRMGSEEQGRGGESRATQSRQDRVEAAASCRARGARSGERSTWSQAPQHLVSARGGGGSPATQGSNPGHVRGRRRPAGLERGAPAGRLQAGGCCVRGGAELSGCPFPRPPRPAGLCAHMRPVRLLGCRCQSPSPLPGTGRRPRRLRRLCPPADPCSHPRPKPAPRTSGTWSWGLAAPPAGTCTRPRPRHPVPALTGCPLPTPGSLPQL